MINTNVKREVDLDSHSKVVLYKDGSIILTVHGESISMSEPATEALKQLLTPPAEGKLKETIKNLLRLTRQYSPRAGQLTVDGYLDAYANSIAAMIPAKLQWTREKPKVDGWYWRMGEAKNPMFPVVVSHGYAKAWGAPGMSQVYSASASDKGWSLIADYKSGWWAGPIAEPEMPEEPKSVETIVTQRSWCCPKCYRSCFVNVADGFEIHNKCLTCGQEVKLEC